MCYIPKFYNFFNKLTKLFDLNYVFKDRLAKNSLPILLLNVVFKTTQNFSNGFSNGYTK